MQEKNQLRRTLLFIGDEGEVSIDAIVDGQSQTLWTNQKSMAEFFDGNSEIVEKHLKRIYDDGELSKDSTCREITYVEGNSKTETFYNLDAVISIAYKVQSKNAIHLRRWFIKQLREYIVKGFILDDESLKYGSVFGGQYFDDLVDEVNEAILSRDV